MMRVLGRLVIVVVVGFSAFAGLHSQSTSVEASATRDGIDPLSVVQGNGALGGLRRLASLEPFDDCAPRVFPAIGCGQAAMFSGGDAYERFMGRWSRALAPLLVKFAEVGDGDAVLDVGSGTGALASAVVAVAPTSSIVGIDPAASYVEFAQARHPGDRVRFEVGDAQQLRFSDRSFDRTLSLLVLNFIPDRSKALHEMIRVTRPGGTVASAVWDYGQGMEMLRIFWDEAIALNPRADAHDERHMPLSRAGELRALWEGHRLRDVSEQALTIPTRFASFDDYWAPFLDKQGPAGAHVAALASREREQLRLRLRKRLLGDGPDGPIVLHARAWAVRGMVP